MPKKTSQQGMEYPDAPSGYVKLHNYKEPFMEFTDGYGYQGVLLIDDETEQLQCHVCGDWFDDLAKHVHTHQIRASQYKSMVGLNKCTALISEPHREKLIAHGMDKRTQNLRPNVEHSQETKGKISRSIREAWSQRRENQNITGTCPAQLIKFLQDKTRELGYVPSRREVQNRRHTLLRVFGTYTNALKRAGLTPRKPGQNIRYNAKIRYSPESLITYINDFYRIHGRIPHSSDCHRGLIPSVSTYRKNFGTFKNALLASDIPESEINDLYGDNEFAIVPKRVKERDEKFPIFCEMVYGSNSKEDIVKTLNITKSTYYRWRKRLTGSLKK